MLRINPVRKFIRGIKPRVRPVRRLSSNRVRKIWNSPMVSHRVFSNGIKKWYLAFLEKKRKDFFETILQSFLYLLSFIYGFVIFFRNFLYQRNIIPSYACSAKIISVGGLSWGGCGKTPLSIWLYHALSSRFKTAILRRGYGSDEGRLLKEKTGNVFSSPDRYALARNLQAHYNLFILDDGFQYHRLKKNINIVIMGAREFKRKYRLIPASFFREPLSALRRADILILNYKEEMQDHLKTKKQLKEKFPHLKIYFAQYRFKRLINLNNNEVDLDALRGRKIAALTAIGYPQGFFNKLKVLNLNVAREITYPDHYELQDAEFNNLQDDLLKRGIKDLVITHKDKYHFPHQKIKLNIFIVEIEMEIEKEENFLQEIEKRLDISRKF
ncbi:MAG: tetraacyldisaccharide 4'-kinase [Candidatus Omnitrophica bacterium]|nr:tetraacyldisaccharide 4'-kinase [Candidatus Omnitrophota bacterium]